MNRRQLANRAAELVGGVQGFTKSYDPEGTFAMVTEGRQRCWMHNGRRRCYSACEDLATRLALEGCGMKQGMAWCNREDAGNRWKPGYNLLNIKIRAGYAWKNYYRGSKWDIQIGDIVQVHPGKEHTFIISEIKYDCDGRPTRVDTCDYGQFFIHPVNRKADHGCRMYVDRPVSKRNGIWCINNREVIGRADITELINRETITKEKRRTLKLTSPYMRGFDVKDVQLAIGAHPDGVWGPVTDRLFRDFQRKNGLLSDGICGPKSWGKID